MVSPGDGKVTDVSPVTIGEREADAHQHFPERFQCPCEPLADRRCDSRNPLPAWPVSERHEPTSAEVNEQNIVTVEGDGQTVVFKQIAGLLARRIVFHPKVGDRLERGQRVGLIKFGSRVDVLFDA